MTRGATRSGASSRADVNKQPSQVSAKYRKEPFARETGRTDRPSLFGNLLGDIKPQQAMGLSYFSTHISHLTISKRSNTIDGPRSTCTLRRPFFRGRGARLPKAAPRTRSVRQNIYKNTKQKPKGLVVAGPHVVCCQGPLRSSLSVLQSYVLPHARKRNFARATDPVRPSVRPSPLPSTSSSSPPPGRSVSTFTTRRRRKSAALRPDTATSASPPPRSAARSTPR